jgi:hypothetical protein
VTTLLLQLEYPLESQLELELVLRIRRRDLFTPVQFRISVDRVRKGTNVPPTIVWLKA